MTGERNKIRKLTECLIPDGAFLVKLVVVSTTQGVGGQKKKPNSCLHSLWTTSCPGGFWFIRIIIGIIIIGKNGIYKPTRKVLKMYFKSIERPSALKATDLLQL